MRIEVLDKTSAVLEGIESGCHVRPFVKENDCVRGMQYTKVLDDSVGMFVASKCPLVNA
jgi:hypothetical protein